MTRDELISLFKQLSIEELDLLQKKNADYTGGSPDPFFNFRMYGALGILVRLSDKEARIRTFIEKGIYQVPEETFRDTIKDARIYLGLLLGMVEDEKPKS